MRILLLSLAATSLDAVNSALAGQGYEIAAESLSAGTVSKRRFWLIAALFALCAVAFVAAVFVGISTRRSRKDALQLRAEIARLNNSLQPQNDLLRRAEQARGSLDANSR